MNYIEEIRDSTALGYIGLLNDRAVSNLGDGNVLMAKEDLEVVKEMEVDVNMTANYREKLEDALDGAVNDIITVTDNHTNAPLNAGGKHNFQQATKLIQTLVDGKDY